MFAATVDADRTATGDSSTTVVVEIDVLAELVDLGTAAACWPARSDRSRARILAATETPITVDGPRTFWPTSDRIARTSWVLTFSSEANSCTLICVKTWAFLSTARSSPGLQHRHHDASTTLSPPGRDTPTGRAIKSLRRRLRLGSELISERERNRIFSQPMLLGTASMHRQVLPR